MIMQAGKPGPGKARNKQQSPAGPAGPGNMRKGGRGGAGIDQAFMQDGVVQVLAVDDMPLWAECRFGRPPRGSRKRCLRESASGSQGTIEEWPSPRLSAFFYIQETLISPGPPCWSARLHSRAPAWVSTVRFYKW